MQRTQEASAIEGADPGSAYAGLVMAAVSSQVLGKRVRSIRRRSGTTLDQLAEATGLNKGYLSRIESGEKTPSIATLLKLADALKVSTGQLFGEEVAKGDIQIVRARKLEGCPQGQIRHRSPLPRRRTDGAERISGPTDSELRCRPAG